jgi:hypothetical protein
VPEVQSNSMKTALVTLIVGAPCQYAWREVCAPGWRAYANRHGYDIIAIEEPLDRSVRALARSPAWQKCLVLGSPLCGSYDRIVWIDSDIVINPSAPAVTAGVPIEKIGVTDEMLALSPQDRDAVLTYLCDLCKTMPPELLTFALRSCTDPRAYHAAWGLPQRGMHILQTGLLVLSPKYHRKLLEHVYFTYEDKGAATNYEMRPLSFEIQDNGLQHLIDRRFNSLFAWSLYRNQICVNKSASTPEQVSALIVSEYKNNYFLHFAGRQDLLKVAKIALDGILL